LVTVLTAEDLARTRERSLPRAIEAAAGGGLWLQETNLGGGAPILRGLVGQHVLIVVDGVRVNDSTTRLGPNQSLNNFDTAIVERVEIVRGPNSLLYGSGAIGGTILIWTKRAGTTGPDGPLLELSTGASAQASSAVDGGTLSLDGVLRTHDQGIFASGTFFDFEDLETGDGTVPFTGYHGRAFFTSYERDLGDARGLRITAGVHQDLDVPRTDRLIPGYGQTQPTDAVHSLEQDRRRFLAALRDANSTGISDEAELRVFYNEYTEKRERRATGSNTFRYERDETQTLGMGADLKKLVADEHLLTYGLDLEFDDVDSFRTDVDLLTSVGTDKDGAFRPDSRYLRGGLFVQDETSFGAYDATFGGRYSYDHFSFDAVGGGNESGDFSNLTLSAQLARDVTENLRTTGTLSQGFRAPNLEDLSIDSTFAGGDELGNPDLDPEKALSADLALDYARGPFVAGLSVFFTRLDDAIGRVLTDVGDPGTSGDETYLRENVGRVDLYGGEASLRHPLKGEGLFAAYSLTLTRGTQHDDVLDPTDGETDARRIPPLFGRVALEARPAESFMNADWLDLELVWADDQDKLNKLDKLDPRINPNGTAGFGVVNLDWGGRLSQAFSWSAGLHNLFDKEYRLHGSGFDAPGRAVVFGLDWHP
jgi:outer membrane receptor protein involved in Fe transport